MALVKAALLLFFLMSCAVVAYTDARYGMVYNRVTFPLAAAGLAYAVIEKHLVSSVLGALVAGGVLLVAVAAGGAGAGDFKMALGLGFWFGSQIPQVLVLGCFVGCAWGFLRLWRAGLLVSWLRTFLVALYLMAFYGVWTGAGLGSAEETPEGSLPPWAVPFGACLAVAAWAVALLRIPAATAGLYLVAGAGTVAACWLVDRRTGVWERAA